MIRSDFGRWSSFGPTRQRIENRTDYEDAFIRYTPNFWDGLTKSLCEQGRWMLLLARCTNQDLKKGRRAIIKTL